MGKEYDAIVVGARCAGAPTAMLLARQGYRVLLVDRATFPSDTISTHLLHPPGVEALRRWGLLERLEATGCPPYETYGLDFGPFEVVGTPRAEDGTALRALCPRRMVLDELLVEAAVAAGAELREGVVVDALTWDEGRVTGITGRARGGARVSERARVVVGADGRTSFVARAVGAARYHERPTIAVGYYAYWSDLPVDGLRAYIRPGRGFAVAPTHDGLTMVVANWPHAEHAANRADVEGAYLRTIELVPEFAEQLHDATRETRLVGAVELPNYFATPYGPGWVLVGDAGHHKDPITAQGISDAFRDAEGLAAALGDVFAGRVPFGQAMRAHQLARDATAVPMFELTCEFATLEPPPAELARLLAAAASSRQSSDTFVSAFAGTQPVASFFAPENAQRILAAAA
jgi:2-polyprenyl-6-methoxyphenol hydroxylase-like FAD-dependent oxidoreductase